jgi:two-component system, OmpR family, sensor histidine kinase QseC
MKPMARSLQGRLLALVLGMVVLVWLVSAAATWFDARHELDELLDSHLAQAAALLVARQDGEGSVGGEHEQRIDAPSLHRYAGKVAFQVFHEGRLVLRSANAPAAPMIARERRFESGFETVTIGHENWRVFATHGAEKDIQVYVGEQLESRASILWAVLRSALWPIAIALPLLALAAGWAVYRGLRPLRELGRALAQRRADALEPVHLPDAPSEMVAMLDALNALFQRIESLLASERRFTADAAHELRTPIAAIRAQAQVAMGEADDALRREALQKTLQGCDRATRLVSQLLTLARLEAQAAPPASPVDLRAIAQRVAADLAPQALAKQQSLELDAPDAAPVAGDETLLEVLVRNLVDNAIRYAPASARIEVRVERAASGVTLTVDDSGPGLDTTQRGRLGERFFRADGNEASGSGLGWSIVQRIAAVHGMSVTASPSARLGGLAVTVVAPNAIAADGEMRRGG